MVTQGFLNKIKKALLAKASKTFEFNMAERVGFEPTVPMTGLLIIRGLSISKSYKPL